MFDKTRAVIKRWFESDDYGGSLISTDWAVNFFQTGLPNNKGRGRNATVEACVGAIVRAISQMDAHHWQFNDDGGKTELLNSPLSKILLKPNKYQTWSDFMMNLIRSFLLEGNFYAYLERDKRFEIVAMHILHPQRVKPWFLNDQVTPVYQISSGERINLFHADDTVPARDIMHIRLYTPNHPLEGVSPIQAAAIATGINDSINLHQRAFFQNMARPSGVLETEKSLTTAQMTELRDAWDNHSKGQNSGGVPILSRGLQWKPLTVTSVDAELIEAQKMSIAEIARVFGVPLPLIGVMENASYNNVESMLQYFMATTLNFYLRHIERAFNDTFKLDRGEGMDFDTDSLLRTDLVGRIEAFTKGITGGLYAPNEARRKEGLKAVENGDEPRVQMQMVPLSFDGNLEQADITATSKGHLQAPDPDQEPEPKKNNVYELAYVSEQLRKKLA